MSHAILAEKLTRDYVNGRGPFRRSGTKTLRALDQVDFEVNEGELFGLLGPNGAGKTTTIKILSTLLEPTSGKAFVKGLDVQKEPGKVRRMVNMVAGGERMLYFRLTGRENLQYFAELYDVPRNEVPGRIENLLHTVGLANRADDEVEKYSKGMKQRLQICRGLINDPQVLLLDEPTLGLDVDIARDIRNLIREKIVHEQKKTVLLTTHYMYEAEEMCQRVAFLNRGRIAALGTVDELKRGLRYETTVDLSIANAKAETVEGIRGTPGVKGLDVKGSSLVDDIPTTRLSATSDSDRIVPSIMSYLSLHNCKIVAVNVRGPTLEDLFMHIVGTKDDV